MDCLKVTNALLESENCPSSQVSLIYFTVNLDRIPSEFIEQYARKDLDL